jgi:hypothetical protein
MPVALYAGVPFPRKHLMIRPASLASTLIFLAACTAGETTAPVDANTAELAGGPSVTAATLRVSCELRAGRRSRVSVDGNNLAPRNATFRSRIASGANTAASGLVTAVGDEAEFDYDSNPADIAQGATAIARSFIVLNASGPDVRAELLDASGAVVATGSADCRTR